MLNAGAKVAGKTVQELGEGFDSVVFCTNVTYADGQFKGGECPLRSVTLQLGTRRLKLPLMADLSSNAIDPNDLSALATQRALRDTWLRLFPSFDQTRVHAVGSIQHAIDITSALGEQEVLVAGSLHLVGGGMEVAGLQDYLGMA